MGLRQLSAEEGWQMSFDERRRRAHTLIEKSTLTDTQKESLRSLVETGSLTNPPDVIIEAKIKELQASDDGNTSQIYLTVPIRPSKGERQNKFMPAPPKWRRELNDSVASSLPQSGEVGVSVPVEDATMVRMTESQPLASTEGEPIPRKLRPISQEQTMMNLKEDIANAVSLDALCALFFDGTPYVFGTNDEDEYWLGSGIKKLIADAEQKKTADEIPDYFPELKQKVRQLLEAGGSAVQQEENLETREEDAGFTEPTIPSLQQGEESRSSIESTSDTFDRISAKYTESTGGRLLGTSAQRELAEQMQRQGKKDDEILTALIEQNKLEIRDSEVSGEQNKIEKNWDAFRETFWSQVASVKTFEALYALIRKVEDGFTNSVGQVELSAETLISFIEEFRNGVDVEHFTYKIPESFRADVLRIKALEEKAEAEDEEEEPLSRTISLKTPENESETSGVTSEPPPLPIGYLLENLQNAKDRMLSAQKDYHDVLLAQVNAEKLGISDEAVDAKVRTAKEIYIKALHVYANLETQRRILEERQKNLGNYRFIDLTESQRQAINNDPELRNLVLQDADGIIPQAVANVLLQKKILTDVDTQRTIDNVYPLEERQIKADVFTELFLKDYARRTQANVRLENQPEGVRGRYEKFQQWFETLPKWQKAVVGCAAAVGTAGAVATVTALALSGAGLGAVPVLTGAFAGASAGVAGGVFRGADKFSEIGTEMDLQKKQEIRDAMYTMFAQDEQISAALAAEGLDRVVTIEKDAYIQKSEKRVEVMNRAMNNGAIVGGATGAALSSFLAYTPWGQTISAKISAVLQEKVSTPLQQVWQNLFADNTANTISSTPTPTLTQSTSTASVNISSTPIPTTSASTAGLESSVPTPPASGSEQIIQPPVETFTNFVVRPEQSFLDMFKELHNTAYDPTSIIDRYKMGIVQMLSEKGVLGVSDGLQVPSPELNTFFNELAPGDTNVDGWRRIATTLNNNFSKIPTGSDTNTINAIKNIVTRS